MARARNIKPGFFANEELVELPFSTRLLFIGLWTVADRSGRMDDKPKRIKMALFPADDIDINAGLDELQSSGFLLRYEVDSIKYIQVLMFSKHQNPHKDEKASVIPPYGHDASTMQKPYLHGGNPADSLLLIPDSLLLIPDSIKTKGADKPLDGNFERAWHEYPNRPGASKTASLKAWNARLKAGVDPNDMLAGVGRYAKYVESAKTDPQFIKQPATFFGPDAHYLSDWNYSQQRALPIQLGSRHSGFDKIDYSEGITNGHID
jgi:hypothetical protein